MNISNAKVLGIQYTVLIYAAVFVGLLTYSTKMIADMMKKMSNEMPAKSAMPFCQQTESISPSVVELFTSEGCSSCPSADKLVAKAQDEFHDNTIVLSYHVDYWNRLGWKDAFSKAIYSDRQRLYAKHMNLQSVYTPQVIVNGKIEFVGSDKAALWDAIKNFKKEISNTISIEFPATKSNQLVISYKYAALQKNEELVLELVLKSAVTKVRSGENGGATLKHINVVQDIIVKDAANGTTTFDLPANFNKENYMIVAFVQNKETFEISNAKKIAII